MRLVVGFSEDADRGTQSAEECERLRERIRTQAEQMYELREAYTRKKRANLKLESEVARLSTVRIYMHMDIYMDM